MGDVFNLGVVLFEVWKVFELVRRKEQPGVFLVEETNEKQFT